VGLGSYNLWKARTEERIPQKKNIIEERIGSDGSDLGLGVWWLVPAMSVSKWRQCQTASVAIATARSSVPLCGAHAA